jgi:predicted RNA-binding protein with PUA-like domain
MAYWLLKTEPGDFSFDDLESKGSAVWDGVSNALALKHLRLMRKGDQAFIYHTGKEKAVVGIASVTSDAYPDPQAGDPKLAVCDLAPVRRLRRPVSLAEIKSDAAFAGFALVRMARLSVMPVPAAHWKRILGMAAKR